MRKLVFLSTLALVFSYMSIGRAVAQDSGFPLVVVKTTPEDAEILKKSKPHGPHEIPVANFVIKTKNNAFMMAIGGFVNPIMGYDINNQLYKTCAGISFVPADIPLSTTKGQRADYYINPVNGAIDFQIVGLGGTKNEISAYIKLATNGMSPWIGYSRIHLSWRGFTMGQKLTLMQDPYACQPPTIDPQGPCGDVSTVAYEINYTSKSYNGFRFAVALDMPTYYSSSGVYKGKDYPTFDDKDVIGDANEMIPDIPMWIEYQKSPANRIRLTGLIRNFQYHDLLDNKVRNLVGWGTMVSGNLNFWKPLTLYCQAAYGKGIGNYLQDIAGKPLSFIPKDDQPGKMKAAPMMGLVFGASINPIPKLQFNVIASQSKIWETGSYFNDYKYTLYACGNMFYTITPYLQWGIEYLWGKHASWDHKSGIDNRIQTQLMFTF